MASKFTITIYSPSSGNRLAGMFGSELYGVLAENLPLARRLFPNDKIHFRVRSRRVGWTRTLRRHGRYGGANDDFLFQLRTAAWDYCRSLSGLRVPQTQRMVRQVGIQNPTAVRKPGNELREIARIVRPPASAENRLTPALVFGW